MADLKRTAIDVDDAAAPSSLLSSVPVDVRSAGIGRRLTCRQLAPLARSGRVGRETTRPYAEPCSVAERARVLGGRGLTLFYAGVIIHLARRAFVIALRVLRAAQIDVATVTDDDWLDLSARFAVAGAVRFAPGRSHAVPMLAAGDTDGWLRALDGGISTEGIAMARSIVHALEQTPPKGGSGMQLGAVFASALHHDTPQGHASITPAPSALVMRAINAVAADSALDGAYAHLFTTVAVMTTAVTPYRGGYRDVLLFIPPPRFAAEFGAAMGGASYAAMALVNRLEHTFASAMRAERGIAPLVVRWSSSWLASLLEVAAADVPSATAYIGLVLRSLYCGASPRYYPRWRLAARTSSYDAFLDHVDRENGASNSRWVSDAFVWFLTDGAASGDLPARAALEMSEVIKASDRQLFGAAQVQQQQ